MTDDSLHQAIHEPVRILPYDPAYLPTARKLDGTVHSW